MGLALFGVWLAGVVLAGVWLMGVSLVLRWRLLDPSILKTDTSHSVTVRDQITAGNQSTVGPACHRLARSAFVL